MTPDGVEVQTRGPIHEAFAEPVQSAAPAPTIVVPRQPPEPACDQPQTVQVLAMEIDYGPFERMLELPAEVDPERVNAEHREGLLWVYLPLRQQS